MERLELLQEIANGHECENCHKTEYKMVAQSLTMDNQYYSTCSSCGAVEVARFTENDSVIFNATSQKRNQANKALMMDAMNAYAQIGMPVQEYCMTRAEAVEIQERLEAERLEAEEEFLESLRLAQDEEDDDLLILDDSFDLYRREEETTYLLLNAHTDDVIAKVSADSKEDLAKKLENYSYILHDIEIYELGRKMEVERQIIVK